MASVDHDPYARAPRMLVVEDEPSIAALLARALRTIGEVDIARDGHDALARLACTVYDAWTLDLHMPALSGWEVLRRASVPGGPNERTPVLVVTADPTGWMALDAGYAGSLYVLPKPIGIGELIARVRHAIAQARATEAHPQEHALPPRPDRPRSARPPNGL